MAHSSITAAENILRESLNKVATEQNYDDPDIKVNQYSTEGANFSSFLFEATISSKDRDDLKLFAKVSAVGESFRSQGVTQVFNIERLFYMELAVKYRELEEKHGVAEQHRFKSPKIYAINPKAYEETFVMENLSAKGYSLHDRFKSVDWEYAAAAFTELAKMHALSMAFSTESPDEFKKYLGEFKFMFDLNDSNKGVDLKSMIEQGMQKTVEAAREDNRGRLMAFLGQMMGAGGLDTFFKFYSPGDFPVIRHGDFRPSNIMHKANKDGRIDVVVVDFQTLLAGNPVIDLYYFIFLGTDKAFRDKYYDQLLEHYYTELSAALTRLGLDPEIIYSRTKFYDEMKENLVYGLVVALMTLSLVTVDSSEAPQVTGEHDMASFMTMKFSSTFAERINGVLDDYVKWGVL